MLSRNAQEILRASAKLAANLDHSMLREDFLCASKVVFAENLCEHRIEFKMFSEVDPIDQLAINHGVDWGFRMLLRPVYDLSIIVRTHLKSSSD